MNALIQERSRRQKEKRQQSSNHSKLESRNGGGKALRPGGGDGVDIDSLVESVKRKSKDVESGRGEGKRRKL